MIPLEMLVSTDSPKLPKAGDGTLNETELGAELSEDGSFWDEALAQLEMGAGTDAAEDLVAAPNPQPVSVQPPVIVEIEQIEGLSAAQFVESKLNAANVDNEPDTESAHLEDELVDVQNLQPLLKTQKQAVPESVTPESRSPALATENYSLTGVKDSAITIGANTTTSMPVAPTPLLEPIKNTVDQARSTKQISEIVTLPIRGEVRSSEPNKVGVAEKALERPASFEVATPKSERQIFDKEPTRTGNIAETFHVSRSTSVVSAATAAPDFQEVPSIKTTMLDVPEQLLPIDLEHVEMRDAARVKDVGRSATIPQIVFSPKALANQISLIARTNGEGALELQLTPQHLGKLSISIVEKEFAHSVSVLAERSEVLELLRKNETLLERELVAAGFSNLEFDFTQSDGADIDQDDSNSEVFSLNDTTNLSSRNAQTILPSRQISALDRLDIRL